MGFVFNHWDRIYCGAGLNPNKIPFNIFMRTKANVPSSAGHTVWPGSSASLAGTAIYTWSTGNDITHVVSDSASDAGPLAIYGFNTNDGIYRGFVVLNGTTPVALPTPLMSLYPAPYLGVSNIGNIYFVRGDSITGGVPNNDVDVGGIIPIGQNFLQQGLFQVPPGYKGSVEGGYIQLYSVLGSSTTAAPIWGGQVYDTISDWSGFFNYGDLELSQIHYRHDEDYICPGTMQELDRLEVRVGEVSANTVEVRGRVHVWLIKA